MPRTSYRAKILASFQHIMYLIQYFNPRLSHNIIHCVRHSMASEPLPLIIKGLGWGYISYGEWLNLRCGDAFGVDANAVELVARSSQN